MSKNGSPFKFISMSKWTMKDGSLYMAAKTDKGKFHLTSDFDGPVPIFSSMTEIAERKKYAFRSYDEYVKLSEKAEIKVLKDQEYRVLFHTDVYKFKK